MLQKSVIRTNIAKDNERVLTGKFQEAAEQAHGLQIFGRMETFAQFFEQLLRYGQQNHFTGRAALWPSRLSVEHAAVPLLC